MSACLGALLINYSKVMRMSVDYQAIGRRIKYRRRQLGHTQDNLAEALSVSVGYVSQIERGIARVNLDTLSEVAAYLKCDLSELVTGVIPSHGSYLKTEMEAIYDGMNPRQRRTLLAIARFLNEEADSED